MEQVYYLLLWDSKIGKYLYWGGSGSYTPYRKKAKLLTLSQANKTAFNLGYSYENEETKETHMNCAFVEPYSAYID